MLGVLAGQLGVLGSAPRVAGFNPASFSPYHCEARPGPTWCFSDSLALIPSIETGVIRAIRDPFTGAIITVTPVVGQEPTLQFVGGRWVIRTLLGSLQTIIVSTTSPAQHTVFSRVRSTVSHNGRTLSSASVNWLLGTWETRRFAHFNGAFIGAAGGTIPSATPDTHVSVRTGSATTYRANGALYGTAGAGGSMGTGLAIGGMGLGNNAEPSTADHYGLIVYNAELTLPEILSVETYLEV